MIDDPNSISKIFQDALCATQKRNETLTHVKSESLQRDERSDQHEAYLQWRLDQFKQPR